VEKGELLDVLIFFHEKQSNKILPLFIV